MANELSISAQFQFSKENATLSAVVQAVLDVTNKNYADISMDVPVGAVTPLVYGDVDPALVGLIVIQNIGDLDVGIRTGGAATSTWRLKAGTATEPGGVFMAYTNAEEIGDLDIEFDNLTALDPCRVTIRMIER